jgi:hypothetical protein
MRSLFGLSRKRSRPLIHRHNAAGPGSGRRPAASQAIGSASSARPTSYPRKLMHDRPPATEFRIKWTPKLRLEKLVRLYKLDAAGLQDEEFLNDLAWALYSRVRDVVLVSSSRVVCPCCSIEFAVRWLGEEPNLMSRCPKCDWSTTAGEYHGSWEHRDLNGHSEEFARYLEELPAANSYVERMRLVDRLLHAAHVSARRDGVAGMVWRNLLEGNRRQIKAVLDGLAGNL